MSVGRKTHLNAGQAPGGSASKAAAIRPIGSRSGAAAPAGRPAEADNEDNDLSTGFMAAVMSAVMIACGGLYMAFGGSLFAFGDDSSTMVTQVSRLDRTCGGSWLKDQSNVDELHCFMTTNVTRLCEPTERLHMIQTIRRFNTDYAVYNSRVNTAVVGSIISVNVNAFELARQDARSRDRRLTEDQRNEALGKVTATASDVLSGVHKVQSKKANSYPYYKLEDDLKALIVGGYIAAKDLDPGRAAWIKRAIAEAGPVKPSC
jgi:hypothetical protein